MGRNNDPIIRLMYRGTSTIQEYNWENLQPSRTILSLMTQEDIDTIRKIILSPRYSGNNKLKMERMDDIMHLRGFSKFAGGTNRIVYEHPDAPGMVFKVAIDSVGIKDSPAEFYNQNLLKPFCCKVFECSACGTIASFEKVKRITTIEEFYSIIDDYYFMITNNIIGKYVMEDIGIKYFMNFGIRVGQGPVILDFPYLFELDGNKLICNAELEDHSICCGEIDYDYGFNKLICTKCGRHYMARDLAVSPEKRKALLRSKGAAKMRVNLINVTNGHVIKSVDTNDVREYLSKDTISSTTRKKNKENKTMKVNIVTTRVSVKNDTPIENNVTPVVNNTVQETSDNNTANKVTKTITVKLGGRQNVETKKEAKPSGKLSVSLVSKPVRNTNSSNNKNKKNNRINTTNIHNSVSTQENNKKKFDKNNNNVEAPIVKRVINVALGGKSNNNSQIIKADTSGHKLNIYTSKVNKEDDKKEDVQEESVLAENIAVDTVVEETKVETEEVKVEDIKQPVEEAPIEEVITKEEVVEDSFANYISGIPSMDDKEEETVDTFNDTPIEEDVSDDLDKFRVWYKTELPEDLAPYEGDVIIISHSEPNGNCPETDIIDYTRLDLDNDDNVYIKDGKAYIITDFEEDDNEVKIIISDYIVDDATQTDEPEVSTDEEEKSTGYVEPITSMSDEDVINRIINASSSKPSLSKMNKNK